MSWLDKFKKEFKEEMSKMTKDTLTVSQSDIDNISASMISTSTFPGTSSVNIGGFGGGVGGSGYYTANGASYKGYANSTYTTSTYTTSTVQPSTLIKIGDNGNILSINKGGKALVEIKDDGSVVWDKDIDIDESAQIFSTMLNLSVEKKLGLKHNFKSKMRDQIFEELISIAKDKGSLNADDLTYLLGASKIMEKLKGLDD